MIDVSLHLDKAILEVLNYQTVEFNDSFVILAKRAIHGRVKPSVTLASTAIAFHVRTETQANVWFTGGLAIRKVLHDYYAALLIGDFVTALAKDFLFMEKKAQEIYAESDVDKVLETLIYNTAYSDIRHSPLLLSVDDDSDKPI